MSTIQQLKNFIRHGKQARANDESHQKHESSPPAQPHALPKMAAPNSEPVFGAGAEHGNQPQAYSITPGNAVNRVAQAGNVAAHHAEAGQAIEHGGLTPGSKKKWADDEHIAKIVAEENESRTKFPRYPGLENWELLEKMGDGAFSNVYRARDRGGAPGEVAIKVVRKYEMNTMQVSILPHRRPVFLFTLLACRFLLSSISFSFTNAGRSTGKQAYPPGFQAKDSKGCRACKHLEGGSDYAPA